MWNLKRTFVFTMCVVCASFTLACNVPVFRYALDHWRPDAYRAVVLHKGPLSSSDQSKVAALQSEIEDQRINLVLKQIDVSKLIPDEQPKSLVGSLVDGQAQLVIHYPANLDIRQPVVSTMLESLDEKALIDSPIRQELRARLAAGQSAVFLLVASGNEAADLAARTTLETELRQLQSTLELPKLTDDPEDKIQGGPALQIEFSSIEMDKENAKEWALRSLLLGSEADLKEIDEPLVFPIFGRGRALWPLVGAGINADNLRESATFVSGACSCQVKEQNPGFDLLLSANWDELLPWTTGIQSSHNLGESVQVAETVPIPTGSNMSNELLAMGIGSATTGDSAPPAAAAQVASGGSTTIIIVAVIAVAVIAVLGYLMTRSKRAVA